MHAAFEQITESFSSNSSIYKFIMSAAASCFTSFCNFPAWLHSSSSMLLGAADIPKKVVCSNVLDDSQAATFRKAVKKHYWYELFMDELPVWGFVGLPPEEAKDDEHIYIYTHKSLEINYNGDRVSYCCMLTFCMSCVRNQASTLVCSCRIPVVNWLPRRSENLSSIDSSDCSDKACCLTHMPYYMPCYCVLHSKYQLCSLVDARVRDTMVQDAAACSQSLEMVHNIAVVPS